MPGEANPARGKERIYGLDVLRGLSILLMVAYHLGYDLVLYDLLPQWVLYNPVLDFLQLFFASVFVAISGASSTFSKNNARRGAKILICAGLVTLATYWFNPQDYVRFGILHFLGVAALLYTLLRPLLQKVAPNPWLCLALFFAGRALVAPNYSVSGLWWLGFRQASFSSADYFPLIPWFFMYLFGVWLGGAAKQGKLPRWFNRLRSPVLEGVGRHTLWVYLLHQPLCLGITLALVWLIG